MNVKYSPNIYNRLSWWRSYSFCICAKLVEAFNMYESCDDPGYLAFMLSINMLQSHIYVNSNETFNNMGHTNRTFEILTICTLSEWNPFRFTYPTSSSFFKPLKAMCVPSINPNTPGMLWHASKLEFENYVLISIKLIEFLLYLYAIYLTIQTFPAVRAISSGSWYIFQTVSPW